MDSCSPKWWQAFVGAIGVETTGEVNPETVFSETGNAGGTGI